MEAEQAVLGGLMLENNCWDLVADQINENDFHLFDHRLIFRAIAELAYHNQPFDVVTLADKISKRTILKPLTLTMSLPMLRLWLRKRLLRQISALMQA